MEYQNRLPPEGINVSRVNPLKQFVQLAIGGLILVVILVVILQLTGSLLAKRIPFSFEIAVMNRLDIPFGDDSRFPEMTNYLNELADRLSQQMELPEGMRVTVHYDDEEVFNAYATVGGHLLFYKGLLNRMPDENTLAMVMAHEISHVLHRDPVASLGGGVVSTIALLGLTGSSGMAGQVLNNAGMITGMQFTRKMEEAADEQALMALNSLYGHVAGAPRLFELFSESRDSAESGNAAWLERFLSTHPRDEDRISQIARQAERQEWAIEGELTPLPADFKRWLGDA